MRAVILAGGYGKRLRPLTEEIPKNIVPVLGKPLIEWQIEWLSSQGIKDFVLLTGYLGEKIVERLGDGSSLGVRITYSHEKTPLGTGGALMNAYDILKDDKEFIMVNGDVITNLKIDRLLELEEEYVGAIALVPLPSPYGIVKFDESGRIQAFIEKPLIKDYWINAGVYLLRNKIFEYLPDKGDIERTAFPKLAAEGKLKAVTYADVLWKSIDTHKDLEEAAKMLEEAGGRL